MPRRDDMSSTAVFTPCLSDNPASAKGPLDRRGRAYPAISAIYNGDVAQTVLDAAENVSGAPKRLYHLPTKIAAAEREVFELEKGARTRRQDRPATRDRRRALIGVTLRGSCR
jgi:hypothetical protein